MIETDFGLQVIKLTSFDDETRCSPANLSEQTSLALTQVNLSDNSYSLLALVTAIGLVVSLVSNMIIIYLFTTNPSNIIAVNLSLSDLLYCTQWPSVIYTSLTRKTWILEHNFVCQAFGFISMSTGLASILTVLAMSIERAIVISYSMYIKRRFSVRGAWLIIVVIWLVAITSSLPPLFGKFNRFTLDPSETSCTLDYLSVKRNYKLYILALYVLYWIGPTIIISISYAIIVQTFRKSSLSLRELECSTTSGGCGSRKSLDLERHSSFGEVRRKLRDSIRLRSLKVNMGANRAQQQAYDCRLDEQVATSGLIGQVEAGTESKGCKSMEVFTLVAGHRLLRRAASSLVLSGNRSVNERTVAPETLSDFSQTDQASAPAVDQSNSSTCAGGKERVGARRHTAELICLPDTIADRLHEEPSAATGGARVEPSNAGTTNSIGSRNDISSTTNNNNNNNNNDGSFASYAGKTAAGSMSTHQSANSQLARTVTQFRLAKTALYLILLWLVSWTPIATLAMINSVLKCHKFSATAVFLANTMTKLGPALDVFIYGISHPKIKSKFKQIFKWLFMFGREPATADHRASGFRRRYLGGKNRVPVWNKA